MIPQPIIVALEGPCCAGKTTLGRSLTRDLDDLVVAFVPCYADHAGGGRYLPRQEAASITERKQALRQLLRVEAARLPLLPGRCDVVLEDRSMHTLLANSYALERMTGTRFLAPSARLLHSSPVPAWLDLVLHLDLPQKAVRERNQGKFPADSIYIDPEFKCRHPRVFSAARWPEDPASSLARCHLRSAPAAGSRPDTSGSKTQHKRSRMNQAPLLGRVIFSDWHGVLSRDPFWTSIRRSATHPLHAQLEAGMAGVFDPSRSTASEWMKGLLSSDQVIAEMGIQLPGPFRDDFLARRLDLDCARMKVNVDLFEVLRAAQAEAIVVVATDNMDCFTRAHKRHNAQTSERLTRIPPPCSRHCVLIAASGRCCRWPGGSERSSGCHRLPATGTGGPGHTGGRRPPR
jgi:hypothetical protein